MPAKPLDNEGVWRVGDRVGLDVPVGHGAWAQTFTIVGFYNGRGTQGGGMLVRGIRGGEYRISKRQWRNVRLWHRPIKQGV